MVIVQFLCGKVLSKQGLLQFIVDERKDGMGGWGWGSTYEQTDATHVSLHQTLVVVLKAF